MTGKMSDVVMKAGWEEKKLELFSNIMYGYTATSSKDLVGPKYLRITDIQNNSVNWPEVPRCQISDSDYKKYKLNIGDIVFARTGATTGKSFLIDDDVDSVFASYLIRVQADTNQINKNFLYYYFQSHRYWKNIENGISGSTLGGFNAKKLSSLPIPLPPLSEQKEIVKALDELFAKIDTAKANIEKNIENVGELFQSKLNEIFSEKGDGWVEKKLKDVCSIIKDGTHYTPTYYDSGYIFLSSKNVTNGFIDWKNVKFIDKIQHIDLQKRVSPKKGDILLAKNGTTGIGAIVDKDEIFDIYVSLALLRPLDIINGVYLLHFINSPFAKKQFNKRLKGIGVPNLHLEEIKEVTINYPISKEKQREIEEYISLLLDKKDKLISLYTQKLLDLEELKKSALEKAFRGELT